MLNGKTIVLGVCGGIAAYKSAEIVSRLKKRNADVHVIMTENAQKFVSELTFRTLSKNSVVTDMFSKPDTYDVRHISLAEKADAILVAPATANIIGKVAAGIADDMLSTVIMACKSKIIFAPAMNHNMYMNPIVQKNISTLKQDGYCFIEPDEGLLACQVNGKGRLPEPSLIVDRLDEILDEDKPLKNKKILITAGPTREAIDPVRFLSNPSSGKMGYALAQSAINKGANVVLVSGPVAIEPPTHVKMINVVTALEMMEAVNREKEGADAIIFSAAVADYRPKIANNKKIKKTENNLVLEFEKNPDIAFELSKTKKDSLHIGFCAETDNLIENARLKLQRKKFDFIIANDVTLQGAGFESDTNIIKIIDNDNNITELPCLPKKELANIIINKIINYTKNKRGTKNTNRNLGE